jgi:hypothetical protein
MVVAERDQERETKNGGRMELHVRGALGRSGVRAGGGRASLANLGVLVTYIDMPSSPAVGVRCGVRIRAQTHIPAYGMSVREDALRPVDARARQYSGAPASSRRHGHSAGARFGIRVLRYRRARTDATPYEPSFPHCVRDKTCGLPGGTTCSRGTTKHMSETTGGWSSAVARSCEQILR